MTDSSPLFVVNFEHAQRAFKCARIDWGAADVGRTSAQWIVTIGGRPVWSFEASESDTREHVESEVVRWWSTAGGPTA